MISKKLYFDTIRRIARILTLFCACLLVIGIPASAARMGSVDINGSEVAYQAQYKAYTEAASGDDAVVCYFTVSNPTAGKNGALCRIILPQSQNVYLYMDAGDLAVMRYDGSEYKKFGVNYQLNRNVTYTLCVFRDGLVFFDGTHCYTYSGNFYGFTDVIAGWSDDSNVFSTKLTKKASTEKTDSDDTEAAETSASLETTEVPAVNPYPPIWVVLALLLGTTSNLLAMAALRSSNMALRTIRRSIPHANPPRRQPAAGPKQPVHPPQQTRKTRNTTQKSPAKKQQHTTKRPAAKPQAASSAPAGRTPSPAPAAPRPAEKRKPTLFFLDEPTKKDSGKPSAAQNASFQPSQPFDLYLGTFWRAHTDKMVPYHFGNAGLGYCIFSPGTDLSTEMFAQINKGDHIWLNPVRFHADSAGQGVLLLMSEIAGIAMAFDFYHADTGKREMAVSYDAEMVNFRPARVTKNKHGTLELTERGIILIKPVQ
ncbi:MAG: hypothetical protein LUE11_09315 [Clostridia bacterium]|nr:hypothetical protein [Clostridia bacterium]